MRLVGAIPAPLDEWAIYSGSAWGVSAIVVAFRVQYYGVVQMDGDDAPGRLVPFAPRPGAGSNALCPYNDAGVLEIIYDAGTAAGAVEEYLAAQREASAR